jgi:hypothetical protein
MTPNTTPNHTFQTARLLAALLFFSGIAAASTTVVATGMDSALGEKIWVDAGGQSMDVFAGVVYIALNQNGQQVDRETLCADLFTDIYLGQSYNTQVLSPDQVAGKNLPQVAWLVDNALMPMQLPKGTQSALPSSDWATTAAQGAGLQLAIWDIADDGGNGFSTGKVQATSSTDPTALYWAKQYESLSAGQSSDLAFVYSNTDPSNGQAVQMLVSQPYSDGGPSLVAKSIMQCQTPTPEPAAFLLVGAGLIAGSFALRKIHPAR